jgi:hypothetical protein
VRTIKSDARRIKLATTDRLRFPSFSQMFDCGCFEIHRRWRHVVLCLAGFILWSTVGLAQERASGATLAKRRAEISALSDSDRAELVRKYQDFQKLSSDEQERLRKLHRDVEGNVALKETMQRYCDWLKDLNVSQREQLRAADTPEKKRLAVDRILQEQKRQQQDQLRGFEGRDPGGNMPPPASSDELKKLMAPLEAGLFQFGPSDPAERERIGKLHGTLRYERLLHVIGDLRHPKEGPRPDLPFLEEFRSTVANAAPPFRPGSSDGRPGDRPPPGPKGFLWLMHSLTEEARREFAAAEGDELLETLFRTLSPEMQSEFLQTPPESQPLFLKLMHLDELRHSLVGAFDLPPQFADGPGRGGPGRGGPGRGGPGRDGPGDFGPGRDGQGRDGPGRDGRGPGFGPERDRRGPGGPFGGPPDGPGPDGRRPGERPPRGPRPDE